MKEQLKSAILPHLPIVGQLRISTRDGKSICNIEVVPKKIPSELDPFFVKCFEELKSYLEGKTQAPELPIDLTGLSSFQKNVLKAMKAIPYGEVAAYKDIAIKMKSKAYQAIGGACGRNPFMLIYPCHRVVGSNGLGGFAHGTKMKEKLLELESTSHHF